MTLDLITGLLQQRQDAEAERKAARDQERAAESRIEQLDEQIAQARCEAAYADHGDEGALRYRAASTDKGKDHAMKAWTGRVHTALAWSGFARRSSLHFKAYIKDDQAVDGITSDLTALGHATRRLMDQEPTLLIGGMTVDVIGPQPMRLMTPEPTAVLHLTADGWELRTWADWGGHKPTVLLGTSGLDCRALVVQACGMALAAHAG